MANNVKAILTFVVVCGVVLLAGCGGTSSASAEAGWNPPRPTGVPDAKWATVVDADPASLAGEDLAGAYCQAVKPESAEEFNEFYDYVLAYVAPLCAALPLASGSKGVKNLGGGKSSIVSSKPINPM